MTQLCPLCILPALWLRERAPSSDQIDRITQQRFINSHQFDPDLRLEFAEIGSSNIQLRFSDGYAADYQIEEVLKWTRVRYMLPDTVRWRAGSNIVPRFDWRRVQEEDGLFEAVEAYLKYGFIILYNTACKPKSICDIASKFGYIRKTNFGEVFEVKTKPNSNDLAYRAVALGPHTDNPYREPTPGIQLLHCLVNETSGGLSTLVDSLSCLDELEETNPEGFDLLCQIPVTFTFADKDTCIAQSRPIISTDSDGQTTGMHYSPRLDWLPLMDQKILKSYQKARFQLSKLLTDPKFELQFKLLPGECMMFDNNRVLHGRSVFDPNEGARHLQGCYIDKDGPESLYRYFCANRDVIN
jgi:gamma-butyrobetaine dioxygenase